MPKKIKKSEKSKPGKTCRAEKIKELKDKVKKEITFFRKTKKNLNIRKATGETWRLIHDGRRVISLIEGDAFTETVTPHIIYIGTGSECRDEISRLGLDSMSAL